MVNYIKSVPGGGKTYVMSFLALSFLMQPSVKMIWTVAGNAAINEGASLMHGHIDLVPADTPLKNSVARLQAYNEERINHIDVSPDDGTASLNSDWRQ